MNRIHWLFLDGFKAVSSCLIGKEWSNGDMLFVRHANGSAMARM